MQSFFRQADPTHSANPFAHPQSKSQVASEVASITSALLHAPQSSSESSAIPPEPQFPPISFEERKEASCHPVNRHISELLTRKAFDVCMNVNNNFRTESNDAPTFLMDVFGCIQSSIALAPYTLCELEPVDPTPTSMAQDEDALMEIPELHSTMRVPYKLLIGFSKARKAEVMYAISHPSTCPQPFTAPQLKLRFAMLKRFEREFYDVSKQYGIVFEFENFTVWPVLKKGANASANASAPKENAHNKKFGGWGGGRK